MRFSPIKSSREPMNIQFLREYDNMIISILLLLS